MTRMRLACSPGPSRRAVLRIVAAMAGLGALGAGVRALAPAARPYRWSGHILDALAELELWHADENVARSAFARIEAELHRYRKIFSLLQPDSEISRLNRDGRLDDPSPELRELLALSLSLGEQSGGAFDISVQPLWKLYEARFWSRVDISGDIVARAADAARDLIDYRSIDAGLRRVALARRGMGVTLNGIAQGFITDRVADMLRNEGFAAAYVDMGEVRTLGGDPRGGPWRVGLRDPLRPDAYNREVGVENAALSVSGGYGTQFEPSGQFHHIFNPVDGVSAREFLDVSVTGPRATLADGLSTAIYVAGEVAGARLLKCNPDYRAAFTRADGSRGEMEAA